MIMGCWRRAPHAHFEPRIIPSSNCEHDAGADSSASTPMLEGRAILEPTAPGSRLSDSLGACPRVFTSRLPWLVVV
jgi:hypothetical protein